jgi:hypothetical protein
MLDEGEAIGAIDQRRDCRDRVPGGAAHADHAGVQLEEVAQPGRLLLVVLVVGEQDRRRTGEQGAERHVVGAGNGHPGAPETGEAVVDRVLEEIERKRRDEAGAF